MDLTGNRQVIDLGGSWSMTYSLNEPEAQYSSSSQLLSAGMKPLKAAVPGNFELDLQANGIIDDPFYGMNIASLTRFEKVHCWYFREFDADSRPGYDADRVFEGLDCFADIYLNGERI